MNPDRQQALNYLRAPASGLWRWAENGAVLVWKDGTTIAFREEIIQLIEWLAPNGLPAFGAIVFLLAACRGKVPKVAEILTESPVQLPAANGSKAALLSTARRQLTAQLEAALDELAKVSRLPSELHSGVKAKCVLAEAIFEPAKVERFVEARAVLRGLIEPFNDADLADPEKTGVSGSYIRQVHIVAEGLKLHTAESLALRLRTGLDALPKEIEINLPSAQRARRLIEELSRDREVGAGLNKLYADRPNWPAQATEQMAPFSNPRVWEFMGRVMYDFNAEISRPNSACAIRFASNRLLISRIGKTFGLLGWVVMF